MFKTAWRWNRWLLVVGWSKVLGQFVVELGPFGLLLGWGSRAKERTAKDWEEAEDLVVMALATKQLDG